MSSRWLQEKKAKIRKAYLKKFSASNTHTKSRVRSLDLGTCCFPDCGCVVGVDGFPVQCAYSQGDFWLDYKGRTRSQAGGLPIKDNTWVDNPNTEAVWFKYPERREAEEFMSTYPKDMCKIELVHGSEIHVNARGQVKKTRAWKVTVPVIRRVGDGTQSSEEVKHVNEQLPRVVAWRKKKQLTEVLEIGQSTWKQWVDTYRVKAIVAHMVDYKLIHFVSANKHRLVKEYATFIVASSVFDDEAVMWKYHQLGQVPWVETLDK